MDAWRWSSEDRIHHILPLHHVHGIINAMTCALYAGATVEMYQKFDPDQVWNRWLATAQSNLPLLTIFMSVPTVYCMLLYQAVYSYSEPLLIYFWQQNWLPDTRPWIIRVLTLKPASNLDLWFLDQHRCPRLCEKHGAKSAAVKYY